MAKVNKALGSVSQIVNNGNRVIFDPAGSYIQNIATGQKMWMEEKDGAVKAGEKEEKEKEEIKVGARAKAKDMANSKLSP